MNELDMLKAGFVEFAGQPDTLSHEVLPMEQTDPKIVVWFGCNIWLYPGQKCSGDAQITAWRGNARIGCGEQEGIWFGLTIEFKDVFRRLTASPLFSRDLFVSEAQKLTNFYVSLGEAQRNSKGRNYTPVDCGKLASAADYTGIFVEISRILQLQNANHLPRPHLQVYRKIGEWNSASNSKESLMAEMRSSQKEMTGLLRLITSGNYPKNAQM